MAQTRKHNYTAESEELNPAPETSYAERARTLVHLNTHGVLSTQSKKHEGYPFGSAMPFALDPSGRPIFLVSSMAMHTHNMASDSKASLFVTVPEAQTDPLGAARLTIIGEAVKVPEARVAVARETYLAAHAEAKYYVDFKDFAFWRLEPVDVYFVGGFGVMGWIGATDYAAAEPDPLAEASAGILEHMNADHEASLLAIAKHVKGIAASEAKMTSVDRLGFHVLLTTSERARSVRIGFPSEVTTAEDCRKVLVRMVKEARLLDQGST
jgi:putative heme iron utilization protein